MGACGLALLGLFAPAGAEGASAARADSTQGPVAFVARRRDGVPPPVLDGRLVDPAWEHAAPRSDLRQVEWLEGAPPSERTEVHLLQDSRAVYVRLLCHDREPGLIRDGRMKRDASLDPDDRAEILFDPFLDRRNAFWFQIGAGAPRSCAGRRCRSS